MLETISSFFLLLLLFFFDLSIQILCIFLLQLLLRCHNTISFILSIIIISHYFIAIHTASLKWCWMWFVMDMLVIYHLLLLLLLLHLSVILIILTKFIHEPSLVIIILFLRILLLLLLLFLLLCSPFQLMRTIRLNTLWYLIFKFFLLI